YRMEDCILESSDSEEDVGVLVEKQLDMSTQGNGVAKRPKDDIQPSVHPTVHCWTATSDLYMGCEEGHFLAINVETLKASLLYYKPSPDAKEDKRRTQKPVLLAMAYHKDGLYAAGSDGIVHFYQIKGTHYQMDDCFDVSEPITSLVFSPDYNTLLVETDKGSVYVYKPSQNEEVIKLLDACNDHFLSADFLTPGNKYCVVRTSLLCYATAMVCCPSSYSVAVGTKVGHVYFIDVTKVETPRVVHRVLLSNLPVHHLQYDQSGQYLITGAAEGHIFILDARPSKLFQVLGYLGNIYNDECIDERGLLKNSVIQKRQYELDYPLSSAVRQKDDTVYGYCNHAPFICKYHLAKKKIPSNQFAPGFLHFSPNSQLLASVAKDGVLFIHDAVTLETVAREHCHSYQGQGIGSLAFSLDGQFILVNGVDDGTLVCLKWKYAIKEEIKKFADKRKELKKGIKKLRKTIQEMMYENEQVPDIERLDQQEFNLDIEEQERLQAESEQEVARVRKEIEMENLAKCYLRDIIKKECWNSMSIKGRAIKCFHAAYKVTNYPMKERSKEELEALERVLQLKKIERLFLSSISSPNKRHCLC
uniref:Cilia- and flagella-associated protein 43 n=1 Tax=Terrapene triunguis TaxID=2587831 RepID=A0A674IBA8_9SAUR